MAKPFKGVINVDIRDSVPDWEPYSQPMAPEGAPNVLYIVLDDVGYSAMEPFGGLIETPNINRIAERGLTYTNFHTTALCSPTRSCLLTGPQPHDERDGLHHRGRRPASRTRTATSRSSAGRSPRCWASAAGTPTPSASGTSPPADEMNLASRKTQWPLGRGFERFYGFLGAETNQWYPDLCLRQPPGRAALLARGGLPLQRRHHRQGALVHPGREGDRARQAVLPLLLPGRRATRRTTRPKEWADKYKGKFDMGYEAYREHVFERQKQMGIVTDKAELSPINPYIDRAERRRHRRGPSSTPSGRGTRSPTTRSGSSAGWPRCTRASSATPTTDRPAARPPRGDGRARQHADRARLGQRRVRRGRPERLGQREQDLQRPSRPDRGEPAVHRRARQPADVQPLSDRLGVGVQHARSSCGSATRTARAARPTR